jgi:hypothetical protein
LGGLSFEFLDVDKKPRRNYKNASKYDPIIKKFWVGKSDIVRVVIHRMDANYLRAQLKHRINNLKMDDQIEVYVAGNSVYLEKKLKI